MGFGDLEGYRVIGFKGFRVYVGLRVSGFRVLGFRV